ncbi:hypothetical protein I6A60_40700 [Frankia sp. AgB1.9]|uniref:hypothetical protein n=1 Tax=Frankia sp. AgB1.9 TaxID=1836968 RepID=UPI0019317F1C|nr:hypothetical protein [Frankia sp. AgB1.9]MBL7554099.1 hypothetical protein [Frankia sp. AgB1.9]
MAWSGGCEVVANAPIAVREALGVARHRTGRGTANMLSPIWSAGCTVSGVDAITAFPDVVRAT